ncbi:MAG: HD domain-containing protein [Desulfobacterales bacterium]|nr:HD domain-containing protein [Desulfobacterales bacterium]
MDTGQLEGILKFFKNSEQLKDTTRSAYTSKGRHESSAEHSWRLCLMAVVLEKEFPGIDIGKLLKLCIIHDLGEAMNGDIPAVDQTDDINNKGMEERKDLMELARPLSPELQKKILGLWDEYENAESQEAKLAKALDKLETLIQHTQGKNMGNIDFQFNINYGRQYTDYSSVTRELRAIIDMETKKLAG